MQPKEVVKSYWFDVPLSATITVRQKEKNIEYAVSQAQGELEGLFSLLNDLRRVDKPICKIKRSKDEIVQAKNEIVQDIIDAWEWMDCELDSIREEVEWRM